MKEFEIQIISVPDEKVLSEILEFSNSMDADPEQHYLWFSKYTEKKYKLFLGYFKKQLVSYFIFTENYGIIKVFKGPISTNKEFASESIIKFHSFIKSTGGLLEIQLPLQTSVNTEFIQYKLFKTIRFTEKYDLNNWSSIEIDLDQKIEEIWKGIKNNHRSSIKKADKIGLVTKIINNEKDILKLSELYNAMYNERKISRDFKNTSQIFKAIFDDTRLNHIILGVYLENKLIGGVICPIIGKTVYYKFGISDPKHRSKPILHLALYEIIKIGNASGIKTFDLGGYNHFVDEMNQIYKINLFKRSFGGTYTYYPKKMYFKLNTMHHLKITILIWANKLRHKMKF